MQLRCQPGYSLEAFCRCGRAGQNDQASSAVIYVNKSDLSIRTAAKEIYNGYYVNQNLDVNFRRQKSGTLEQKCSTIFPEPPVVVCKR